MIKKIKFDQIQRQHSKIDESLSINIHNLNVKDEGQSTTGFNGQFIHSQLLIDCLIRMKSNPTDQKMNLSLYVKNNIKEIIHELKIINEFEKNYSPNRSIWWYTRQSFLYRLLNKALRVQNIDLIYLFRFFIRDIQKQLEKNKCTSTIRVYRGQLMSKDEIEILKNSIGEFISINSFFSTSLNRQLSSFVFINDRFFR